MNTRKFYLAPTVTILLGSGVGLAGCGSDPANSGVTSTTSNGASNASATSASTTEGSAMGASTGGGSGSATEASNTTVVTPTAAATTGVGGASGTNSTATSVSSVTGGGPASCSEAAAPYVVSAMPLDASLVPASGGGGFNSGSRTMLPVSVGAAGEVYFGLNSETGAVVANSAGMVIATTPDATLGGVAATANGVAALYFGEMWAQVKRYDNAGQELFSTDLFRSPNLDDEGTKGEASTSRLGYVASTDTVVAYFGHTQRYDDGVRHQGGYLATVDAQGNQELLNGWFGSHNLDQRLWTGESAGAVIGLGDAYPIGIFYSELSDNPRPQVIYRLAAAGNGAANGQLGGIVELGQELIMPFITNLSVSPDVDAGEWPNIDETVASQIREAAANGTDMGLLRVPKAGDVGDGDAPTIWLAPELTDGARLVRLKSARYGEGDMVLLVWAEAAGDNRSQSLSYFTMVVDPEGAVCQPKTALDAAYAVTSGDDIVRGPSGQIYWANTESEGLSLITLAPQ